MAATPTTPNTRSSTTTDVGSERPRADDASPRPKDARSSRTPPAGREFLAGNRLFNEDALKNRAELEPIDQPARSTTPHQPHVFATLGIVLVGAAAWLLLGAVDHSLWLNAERLHDGAASPPVPERVIRLRTVVPVVDGELLTPGMTAYVFRAGSTDTFIEGSISRVARETDSRTTRIDKSILQIDVSPKSALVPEPGDVDPNYRLRIPIGRQTPVDLLIGLVRQRTVRTGNG